MPLHERSDEAYPRYIQVESRLVAKYAEFGYPSSTLVAIRSDGQGLQLRGGVQYPRPGRRQKRHLQSNDRFERLVAGRLWSLRAIVHSDGVAQRRYLPNRG